MPHGTLFAFYLLSGNAVFPPRRTDMPKSVKRARMTFTGLCTTCVNNPSCTFPRNASVPVMQCLEFQGDIRVDGRRANSGHSTSAPAPDPALREPGLCSWCENRPTCTFPKSEGGVWSCEEFQ